MPFINGVNGLETIIGDTFLDRVDELASTPEIFTVPKECQVFDFMTEKVSSYLPSQGKGYYEFVNPEFIAPNKQVLLISKVSCS